MQSKPNELLNYEQVLESLEYVLTQFGQNQSENLQVHAQYLNHQVEYVRTFFQLMQQQNSLFAKTESSAETLKPKVIESLERGMIQFHSHQGDTLRVHEQYLQDQVEYTKNFFQLVQQEYEQILQNEGSIDQEVKTSLTIPVTNKAAQPSLEIKEEVKETNTVTTQSPVFEPKPEPKPETKPEPVITNNHRLKEESPTPPISPTPSSPTNKVDLSDLDTNLLAITSEKTGYPVEMLEMDMDMEADLGIDSIKRVEIMGALQEMYPDLPKSDNLEELGELRTIGQIVEYLQSMSSQSSGSTTVETKNEEVNIDTVAQSETIVETPEVETEVAEVSNNDIVTPTETADSIDTANLGQTMLEITSEKTGYPVEMLEMDMDMEADLGIDSIKRVEIMGALQEAYPDLPKPDNLEEIGELRTIGQIVEYLQALSGGEKKKATV